jgi:hypothetical protein
MFCVTVDILNDSSSFRDAPNKKKDFIEYSWKRPDLTEQQCCYLWMLSDFFFLAYFDDAVPTQGVPPTLIYC